jgi:hypothetical protein
MYHMSCAEALRNQCFDAATDKLVVRVQEECLDALVGETNRARTVDDEHSIRRIFQRDANHFSGQWVHRFFINNASLLGRASTSAAQYGKTPIVQNLAPGLTARNVLENFSVVQMTDVHMPTTDGRELTLTRYTQPEPERQLLLEKLKLALPPQAPPKITAAQLTSATVQCRPLRVTPL